MMSNDRRKPSSNRDAGGKFVSGNRAAKGRRSPEAPTQWRQAFRDGVTAKDVQHVVAQLVSAARDGERWAVELLLERCLGKPATYADIELQDRIEALEHTLSDGVPNGTERRMTG